jgi:putative aldouronate transport system permease protein
MASVQVDRSKELKVRRGNRLGKEGSLLSRIWRDRVMYLFILPPMMYFVVFVYVPLAGYIVAFKDYSIFLGFRASPWVGFENFERIFTDPDFRVALKNTLQIWALQLLFSFPAPLALALLLNSLVSERLKRTIQSAVYLPHFLSWVIVISLWQQIFGGAGFINSFLRNQDLGTIDVMTNPDFFKPLIILQGIWKEAGWGTILFLAALTKIEIHLYEAAVIDGAGGWRRMRDVTIPGIMPVISLLLILSMGAMLSTGFEQFYLQRNAVGPGTAEVLDTFIYYRGIQNGDVSYATAVGLARGIFGCFMVVAANRFAKRLGGEGIF